MFISFAEEGDGAEACGHEELDSQDGVDLANKLHPDIQGCLRYRSTKLEVIGNIVVLAARGSTEESSVRGILSLISWWRLGVVVVLEGIALRRWLIASIASHGEDDERWKGK